MKRCFDLIAAALLLVLLSPLLVVLAVLVRIRLGGPVLFRQKRVGWQQHIFTLYKFRTMSDARDEKGALLPDKERLGAFGLWMRKYSLDEWPQLLNVLRGELSLVGPRPLLVEYLPRYSTEQLRRHEVRPGITGWAQVNGRNALSWEEKFALDVWYVDHRSFALDLKILWRTGKKLRSPEGVHVEGQVTMPEFQGSGGSGRGREAGGNIRG